MKKVLILEDVVDAAQWLAARVRAAFGAETAVTLAHTLGSAERLAAAGSYDLYVVDLGLPDGDGVDFIRALDPARSGADVVVTTIYDDDDHVFRALRAGARGYLLKDQPVVALERALQGLDEGIPPLSPSIARRMMDFFASAAPAPAEEVALTAREREILVLIAGGRNVSDAAVLMNISVHTARGYVKDIYRKLGISSRAQASLKAAQLGLIRP